MNQVDITEVRRILLPVAILAVGIGGFLVFGQRPEIPQRDVSETAPLVETGMVEAFEDAMTIEVEGVAIPYRQVTVSAEVSGRVTSKQPTSRAGSFVRSGDLLLQIDPTDYELEVARYSSEQKKALAEIEAVEIDIASSQELLQLADEDLALRQRELMRRKTLLNTSAISESEIDEAGRLELASRNARQTLMNQLASLRQRKVTLTAAAELVDVQLQRANVDLGRARITSPLSATVSKDYVEQDDYVNKGDPLYLLSETGQMEVKCSLRVDQMYWLWLQSGSFTGETKSLESVFQIPNTPVQIVFDYEGVEYSWDGVLSRYEGTGLDTATRMVPCRVQVDKATGVTTNSTGSETSQFLVPALFSGMFVTVKIPVRPPVPLLSVPIAALRPGEKVWVVRDGVLAIESVKTVLTESGRAIIRQLAGEPLAAGDRVVTSPLAHIKTGMPVAEVSK